MEQKKNERRTQSKVQSGGFPASSRLVVQFLHPGTEYSLRGKEGTKDWNLGDHHRKFMQARGNYVDGGHVVSDQQLMFWGEWEPQSRYREINRAGSPRYLHRPCLDQKVPEPVEGKVRQNTDPFVFSDAFYYRCCKQMRASHPTQLASLDRGSVILFGSHVDEGFAIDTVFVVDESRQYRDVPDSEDLKGFVPESYPGIVSIGFGAHADPTGQAACGGCAPVAVPSTPRLFRCYRGATWDNPVNGMYSFVPCMLAKDTPRGFKRPVLLNKDFDFISDRLAQSYKYTRDASLDEARAVWEKVRAICHKNGFLDGVRFYYEEM